MFIRRYSCVFFLILSCFINSANCADLHAILVVDTNAYDLREAMVSNYWAWQIELKNIACHSGLELKTHIFKDDRANSNFIEELKDLSVEADDVILFYWSGHGFRTNEKDEGNNPWPSFSFNGENVGFDLQELTEYLACKHPRLLISLADTCNNYIPDLWAPPLLAVKMQKKERVSVQSNYFHLFREASGVIMAAGCHPGQYSWAYIPIGSIFTLSLLDALRDVTAQGEDVCWEAVFGKTLENLEGYEPPEEQTPIIEININQVVS